MNIFVSCYFEKKYRKLVGKNMKSRGEIDKRLVRLKEDASHPLLRLHKLAGKEEQEWSISVEKNLRIIFQKVRGGEFCW